MGYSYSRSVSFGAGDGSNDVPMLQEASVGVAIRTERGSSVAGFADFAISEFRHVATLLPPLLRGSSPFFVMVSLSGDARKRLVAVPCLPWTSNRSSVPALCSPRFLQRLLFVHGRLNFLRISKVILWTFFKSILLAFPGPSHWGPRMRSLFLSVISPSPVNTSCGVDGPFLSQPLADEGSSLLACDAVFLFQPSAFWSAIEVRAPFMQ